MYRTDLDSVGEGEGGMIWENSIETCILSSVKQIATPGWMHETSTQGWCTGKTQRDGMGRGDQDGEHVNPWLIHVNVWQKPLQYCKVISLQLIKINEKKKSLSKKKKDLWKSKMRLDKTTPKSLSVRSSCDFILLVPNILTDLSCKTNSKISH